MADHQQKLKARQQAAQVAYDRMISILIGFTPCGKLAVDDVLYIARTAQTLAFEATEAVEASAAA